LSGALSAAAGMDYAVEKADAADWVETRLAEPAAPGITRVFFHTIVWQYLSERVKDRIRAALTAAGAAATEQAPLALLQMEAENHPGGALLRRTMWPGGETEVLGLADYHCRSVDWA